MIARFIKFYPQYDYRKTLKMKSYIFLELYKQIKVIESIETIRLLGIVENHLYAKSRDSEAYFEIYNRNREIVKESIEIVKKTEIKEEMSKLKALKYRLKNRRVGMICNG